MGGHSNDKKGDTFFESSTVALVHYIHWHF